MTNEIEPEWRSVQHLARDLMLAQGDEGDGSRGRAVFLVGAGCSVSAGIPAAGGVSRRVAIHLARAYSHGSFTGDDPDLHADEALRFLVSNSHVDAARAYLPNDEADWGGLYTHFFAEHLKSPNQQRELIYGLILKAKDKLNWAHACLGELVNLRYVNTVLTTNFDQLVLTGIFRTGIIPVVADGLYALNRIVAEPLVPQVIHLHGSMNTYAMRNDPRTLAEPMHDHRAVTMLNGVLQRANLLVVVGYAGGEEGLMDLILQASGSLEQLVVYWVSYEDDAAKMTPKCRQLLWGENKFAIVGGEADLFFFDLMAALGIGEPDWVSDPIAELHKHRVDLVASQAVSGASLLIEGYRSRIEEVARIEKPAEDARQKAARLRAEGDYGAARGQLADVDLSNDPEAARLHALNALSLFEEAPAKNAAMLDAALAEFESLVLSTEGRERLENVLSLLDALYDRYDWGDGEAVSNALDRMLQVTTEWLGRTGEGEEDSARARLFFYRAQAEQRKAEAADDDIEGMRRAVEDFRAARAALDRAPNRLVSVKEISEGLAAALQVLGSKNEDEHQARDAVQLFREVVEHARRDATLPEDEGGLFYNLAGALLDLMARVDVEERQLLATEARAVLARAERAYTRAGDAVMLANVWDRGKKIADLDPS